MSDIVRFTISLETELLEAFDRFVEQGKFPTRSEAIRQLIHEGLFATRGRRIRAKWRAR